MNMRTLPTGLALFMGKHVVEYALLMAGVVLSLIPITAAYLSAQKILCAGNCHDWFEGLDNK
jgi:multiple sugar transport system permease protein